MIGKIKAVEIFNKYRPLVLPVDAEDIAKRERLTITIWPLLTPVKEVKVGRNIGLRDGLSNNCYSDNSYFWRNT
jgi:hypothetical protein